MHTHKHNSNEKRIIPITDENDKCFVVNEEETNKQNVKNNTSASEISIKEESKDTTMIDDSVIASDMNSLKQQLADVDNKYKRLLADFQNYRNRNERLLNEERDKEKRSFIFELLEVIDNFERCLNEENLVSHHQWRVGVDAIYTQLRQILKKHNVEQINSIGEKFNPDLHEAIAINPVPDAEEGTINKVFKEGYKVGDTVLRHAKVSVVKNQQQ